MWLTLIHNEVVLSTIKTAHNYGKSDHRAVARYNSTCDYTMMHIIGLQHDELLKAVQILQYT